MAQYIIAHSFLFVSQEREAIYRSSSSVDTRPVGLVTRLLFSLWSFISTRLIPDTVAPSAITMVGLLSCMQAYQLIHTYYHYDSFQSLYSEATAAAMGDMLSQQHLFNASGAGGGGAAFDGEDVRASIKSFGMRGAGHQAPLGPAKVIPTFHMARNGGGVVGGPGYGGSTVYIPTQFAYVNFLEASRTVQTATVLAAMLLLVAVACGSLDGVHAKRCRSATSLGDIFSRVCTSLSRIFIALILLEVTGISSIETKWYVLLFLQLIEYNTVLGRINAEAIKKDKVKNWAYVATYCFRDSELSFLMLVMIALRWVCPTISATYLQKFLPTNFRMLYIATILFSFCNIALLRTRKRVKSSMALCLAARVVPLFYLLPLSEYNILSVVGDAMVVGLLSIEAYVSHLAQRRQHAAVTLISILSLLNDIFAIAFSFFYLLGILVDLSYSLNVPLFVPVRNVYIDGVFDLCHAGHKKMMANALRFGNRLIVGVCGDEECEAYKRRPIMTTQERVDEVRLCKYVSEVVPNAPVSGITEEMVRYYNVHIVACGEEYETPEDTYYAVPRRMGILRTVPRTQGISTSVLIKRIRAASDEETAAAKDKLDGKSKVQESG